MNPKKNYRRYRVSVSIHDLDSSICRSTHSLAYIIVARWEVRLQAAVEAGQCAISRALCQTTRVSGYVSCLFSESPQIGINNFL
jgi:hypothetical protein